MSFVFCVTLKPFCPIIVVGIVSGLDAEAAVRRHRGVRADRQVDGDARGPARREATAKVVVVIPFEIFVLPTKITRTPLASITRSRSGNAAPPWETKIAGPCSLPGSVGVFALRAADERAGWDSCKGS